MNAGCGLNVSTPSPLMSLEQLIPPGMERSSLSMENAAAMIMATFDSMWERFIFARGSFEPFMDLYLERWLHSCVLRSLPCSRVSNGTSFITFSDQLVKLTTVDPPIMVRIVGITPEHGLLRTIPEGQAYYTHRGESFIDLQPDGNSFDLMAGLIKTKT